MIIFPFPFLVGGGGRRAKLSPGEKSVAVAFALGLVTMVVGWLGMVVSGMMRYGRSPDGYRTIDEIWDGRLHVFMATFFSGAGLCLCVAAISVCALVLKDVREK